MLTGRTVADLVRNVFVVILMMVVGFLVGWRVHTSAFELLAAKRGSAHEAQHAVMECLGEMLWASQRSGLPPDGEAYIDCVRRRAIGS